MWCVVRLAPPGDSIGGVRRCGISADASQQKDCMWSTQLLSFLLQSCKRGMLEGKSISLGCRLPLMWHGQCHCRPYINFGTTQDSNSPTCLSGSKICGALLFWIYLAGVVFLPLILLSFGTTTSKSLNMRLKNVPKNMAMTVHVNVITL